MERRGWHEKVAYQIYPKSFYDANGDGIGDLQGILARLDYLQALGGDILWLSPIYCSPLADQGYDISDYYGIDPRFGTMEELETLIAEGRKRGIGILMDLVVNHCSDEHEWFRRACADPDGPYGRFFYIEPYDGAHLPCNWRSTFGGPCWDVLPGHPDKVYFHTFHRKQPDLNWENPQLRQEVYKMMRWWLDKGLAGFRVDAIINIKKPLPWRDFPPDREDNLCSVASVQTHATGIGAFLREMNEEVLRPYNAFTAAELFGITSERLPEFEGEDGYFSTLFDFSSELFGQTAEGWHTYTPITPEDYKRCCFAHQAATAGVAFPANIIENHDEPRGVSRYIPAADRAAMSPAQYEQAKKMLGGLNFFLRGLPFLYQGQELGMENSQFRSIAEMNDVSAAQNYALALAAGCSEEEALAVCAMWSRDNARTPFQWDDSHNAGFTAGIPWMRVNPNYTRLNLAQERTQADSVFHFYQKLIALRKDAAYVEVLAHGSLTPYLPEQGNLMAYLRRNGGRTILVAGNFQMEPQEMALPAPIRKVLLTNSGAVAFQGNSARLEGYAFLMAELA